MNKKLFTIFFTAALGLSGCSFNIGTGVNSSNTPAGNTTPSTSSVPAANAAPAVANSPKSPEAAKPATGGSDDPKSDTEQIQFAKGTRESTLDRTIAPGVNKMYLLNAKKGQHLYFEVTEETGQLGVDFNKRSVELGENVQWELTSSGDWAIYVNNPTQKTLKYKLFVGIDD